MKTILFVLPSGFTYKYAERFSGIGDRIAGILFPGLNYDLEIVESDLKTGEYIIASLLNALVWALLVLVLTTLLLYARHLVTPQDFAEGTVSVSAFIALLVKQKIAFLPPFATLVLVFFFFTRYPRIQAGKMVESVDRDLIYALKDLLVQINSGVSLYNAMHNVARSGYGKVSEEFGIVVQDINAGEAQDKALGKMAMRTESDFLRRTIWQIVTALKSGASLQNALSSVLMALRQFQSQSVKAYSQELNLWVLIFIISAVAIPSLGVTLLVILSTFGGVGVNEYFIMGLLAVCFFVEFVLIRFVKLRRPVLRV